MREIKFRGFDKETKTMFEITDMERGAGWITHRPKDQKLISNYKEEDFNLMQFTGLLDKNGKEIYEGDIVKTSRYLGTPGEFEDVVGRVRFRAPHFEVVYSEGLIMHCELHGGAEIIGNIYENKELLEREG